MSVPLLMVSSDVATSSVLPCRLYLLSTDYSLLNKLIAHLGYECQSHFIMTAFTTFYH